MKVFIQEGCIGCGLCESTCPSIFHINEEGYAEVYGEVCIETMDEVKGAEQGCPVHVIVVEE